MAWRIILSFYDSISQVEIELTTRCNASCPQCARNFYGGREWPNLPIVDLPLEVLQRIENSLKPLTHIRLCGTYGDPCIHPRFLEVVEWLQSVSNAAITINTNGAMHRESWWKKLGTMLRPIDKVFFGIDGLEDTHSLHRRGTSFTKVIRNLKALNSTGAQTVWSYLVFEHNQHQVEEAREMSKAIGCANFAVKSTSRFMDKTHKLVDQIPVQDRKDRVIYWIKPTTDSRYVNTGYDVIKSIPNYPEYLKTNEIRCQMKHTGLISISAEGYALPCGYLLDRFYGYEAESHPDRAKLLKLISDNGGFNAIDIVNHSLETIAAGPVFTAIEESWKNGSRLERCAHQCGTEHQLLQRANKDLARVWSGKTLNEI